MEIINCPLCGSIDKKIFSKILSNEKQIFYWKCQSCSLIFQSPQMDETELTEFYAEHYREYLYDQVEPLQTDIEIQKARAKHLISIIQRECGDLQNSLHLDIGCGSGELVKEIQSSLLMQSFGIEPDNAYRQYAINQGLKVYESLPDWERKGGLRVKLVSMSHVLEHMLNPIQTLTELRRGILDPGGFILIEVPNLYFHSAFELAHNFAFSTHTLKEVLIKSGYKSIYIKRHGLPLKKTPRYITVLAQAYEGNGFVYHINPEFPGIAFRRRIGRAISRVEDLIIRYSKKLKKRISQYGN
ncbi:MAG: class I SAM-dependent methyltransferase [Anaerolineaceae bacterium]|nr:class I SAM-dependent methyltransferase [Anaerolineaceae bacterium]